MDAPPDLANELLTPDTSPSSVRARILMRTFATATDYRAHTSTRCGGCLRWSCVARSSDACKQDKARSLEFPALTDSSARVRLCTGEPGNSRRRTVLRGEVRHRYRA